MEQATGKRIKIVYQSRSTGRHMVTGPATKEDYGYRRRGDVFEIFEADMRVRPDLFRRVNPVAKPQKVVAKRKQARTRTPAPAGQPLAAPAPPPPPKHVNPQARAHPVTPEEFAKAASKLPPERVQWPLAELDWSDTRVNQSQIDLLAKNGIRVLADLSKTNEAQLLQISGIGEATVRALYAQWERYNL